MHTYEKIVRKSFPPKSMPALVLEAAFFRKGSLLLFGLVIKNFCFESNLDQRTENKKELLQGQKVVRTPF